MTSQSGYDQEACLQPCTDHTLRYASSDFRSCTDRQIEDRCWPSRLAREWDCSHLPQPSSTELVDSVSGLEAVLHRVQLSCLTRLLGKTKTALGDKHVFLAFDFALSLAVLSTLVQLIPSHQPV